MLMTFIMSVYIACVDEVIENVMSGVKIFLLHLVS